MKDSIKQKKNSDPVADSPLPSVRQLEAELKREVGRRQYHRALRSTVYMLVIAAAAAILVAVLFMPVLRIYGSSMTPELMAGDIVCAIKGSEFERGDVVAFYYNNKILVKRVIATSGEWVDIDTDGIVSVDGETLDEPYVEEAALGECDIQLPYQVPDGRVFVMGDHRSVSLDSRSSAIGCISEEQIVGRLVFRVWPLSRIGILN